ncbi:flagellar basal body P-ring formation chaperone FlgA [Chitinivibrio alkaliphilus]|uniref:Flagella basal body P-ring formation protein FlgA n=1 Tax=Chitinivibrio alkaliphilus ACht1 TaxID=1313304 RepID=U7DBG5_9BACT|nr:flagellar basal body P-ring formation chaperone FlgA [Chitinivibrio alkaliphilus]ERP39357.1 flagella basal body P-ring formation protein FlgA [Chitinivibrio alkaliphilus ACht1]
MSAVAFVLFCISLSSTLEAMSRVQFLEHASVTHETVYLGDIARITGPQGDTLMKLPLGAAPLPGRSHYRDTSSIIADLFLPKDLHDSIIFSGSSRVRLSHRADTIYAQEILPVLTEILQDSLTRSGSGEYEVVVEENHVRSYFLISKGSEYSLSIRQIPSTGQGERRRVTFTSVSGEYTEDFSVQFGIVRWDTVAVADRDFSPGETITPDAVTWQRKKVSSLSSSPVLQSDFSRGLESRSRISSGSVLTEGRVRAAPHVRRGDVVELVYGGQALQLTMRARARQNGYVGDIIQVENMQSQKIISARITDTGRVELTQGGRS